MPDEQHTPGGDAERASGTSARFDRIEVPDPMAPRRRDAAGKEALYSTAPSAAPSSQVLIRCRRCDVESGLSVVRFLRLLRPPMLWNPVKGELLSRCPTCQHLAWLHVRQGQALRAFFNR